MGLYPLEQVSKMLRKKRRRIEATQKKAADAAGLSTSQVNRIEKNTVNPSYRSIYKLYEALNQLEQDEAANASELMHEDISWAKTTDSLEKVARKMRKNDFSQLPVKNNEEKNIGRITEQSIIEAADPDLKVEEVMKQGLMEVNPGTDIEIVKEILRQEPALLVKTEAGFHGIITKSDLL